MNKRINQIILLLKADMGLMLSISFGLFLFILFFQPFTINRFDFNNRLLFVAGFGGIIFILMAITRVSFHWIINHYDNLFPSYLSSFLIWVLSTISFVFYLRFVGMVPITFFIVFKTALICLAPTVILRVHIIFKEIRLENILLKEVARENDFEATKTDFENTGKNVEFVSENRNEQISLPLNNVVLIKSANNYIEIVYTKEDSFKRKLLRNTLKSVEDQLQTFPFFIRCHRMCIVNIHFIESLHNNANRNWITVLGLDEEIPVSRQYLLKLKEVI